MIKMMYTTLLLRISTNRTDLLFFWYIWIKLDFILNNPENCCRGRNEGGEEGSGSGCQIGEACGHAGCPEEKFWEDGMLRKENVKNCSSEEGDDDDGTQK